MTISEKAKPVPSSNQPGVAANGLVSTLLIPNSIYTRRDLKAILGTKDATINTGIFRPAGSSSILIFITKNKTADRTPYKDLLNDDVLYCQGQSAGRTDALLAEHRQRGLELLVFYRESKHEHTGAGFRFEGLFDYISHSGTKPANFVMQRRAVSAGQAAVEPEKIKEFNPTNVEDARQKVLSAIARRQGQPAFRQSLLAAYGGCCAVTGTTITEVLEAAHIVPYKGPDTNHISNGLLLRADLHTLFDLGMVAVNEKNFKIIISAKLQGTEYAQWQGERLRLPESAEERPSPAALRSHRESSGL